MGDILVIKLGAFGDVIQAEGAYKDIRAFHASDRITVLTTRPYKKILERCPWFDEVWAEDRAPRWHAWTMWKLRGLLRSKIWTRVYDLQNSRRTSFYYRWFLRGTPWSGTAPGCSHPHHQEEPKKIPSLLRLTGQLEAAGVAVRHTLTPDLSWMADEVDDLLQRSAIKAPFVVLLPGSSARLPQKRWPYYRDLAEWLTQRRLIPVTIPGPDELDMCHGFAGHVLTDGRFLNFFQLAGVLRRAAFVVGNDSGPSHMAAHLGVPGIALFGPHASPRMTSIERPLFRAIQVDNLQELSVVRVGEYVMKGLHLDGLSGV